MVMWNAKYELPRGEAVGESYRGPDLARPRVLVDSVGDYGGRDDVAGSYIRMTSEGKGVLNYVLAKSGGEGQPYETSGGGGNVLGGGGGRDVFV